MKRLLYLSIYFILFTSFSPLHSQNTFDSDGKKTGHWVVLYPNGKIRYESDFIADKPVGLMKRYYENGGVSAEMMFDTIGDRCYARLFHGNRKLAAEGWYIGQKKDSVWTYYSEYDEHIILREPYENGMLQGIAISYYPNGQRSEQTGWVNNLREGPWLIYFEDGGLRSKGNYKEGSREGDYMTYYADSTLELCGKYKNNVADGDWMLYDETGKLVFTYQYRDGKLLNESELLNSNDEVLNKLQDIPEPSDIEEE